METKFKTLICLTFYVDVNRLFKGIYGSTKPSIYLRGTTIESLIEESINSFSKLGINYDTYVQNLKQCRLVDITISIKT